LLREAEVKNYLIYNLHLLVLLPKTNNDIRIIVLICVGQLRIQRTLQTGTTNVPERLEDDISPEFVFLFDVLNKQDYKFYIGIGARLNVDEGIVVPVGSAAKLGYPLPAFSTENWGKL